MMSVLIFGIATGGFFALILLVAGLPARLHTVKMKKRLSIPESAPPAPSRAGEKQGNMMRLHYFLLSAGLKVSARTFVMVPGLVAPCCTGAVFMVTGLLPPALLSGLVVLGSPIVYLLWKRQQTRKQIVMEMPDAVGMVVRSLRIGMGVDAALKEAGDSLSGPLATEIRIIYREMAVGIPFTQAFQGFSDRYPSLPDVRLFCSAFILQRETGGNLAELLQSLARTIQNRFTFKRQIRSFTAEARMSAVIISLLPLAFALVSWLMNPGYISKLTGTALGQGMIYAAIGLEIAGFLTMRHMAQIKI